MNNPTRRQQITDDTGTPLTDAEITAVDLARPIAMMVVGQHPRDRVMVDRRGILVLYGDGPGVVQIARAIVDAAVEEWADTTVEDA